jgi:flavin reductase (DIM6/NTAB) family NADH-FMN oxidoreductase RutF
MKLLIKKLLFRTLYPKPFFGVRIFNGQIEEKVFLQKNSLELDVSDRHNIVCESPFCIAIWVDKDDLREFDTGKMKLRIEKKRKLIALLNIRLKKKLEQESGAILVLQIIKVRCYQLNLLHQFILISFFFSNKKHVYAEAEKYGAIYSYPRRVIVTSFKNDEYYNIFPMDFQGEFPEANIYLLGLKATNITVNKIIESKRVVVSTTEAIDTKTIYDLGVHHSKTPPKVENLPFNVEESELLKFPVPEFSSSYREIEIINSYKLGSHIMLVGKILNSKNLHHSYCSLYHVHFFEHFGSGYAEV